MTESSEAETTVGERLIVRFILNKNIQPDITFLVRESVGKMMEKVFVLPSASRVHSFIFTAVTPDISAKQLGVHSSCFSCFTLVEINGQRVVG